MFGIVLVDKPLEITSHDVVGILRKRFKTKRVGHAGTLDPLASGLLVVAVGPATRFLQYLPLEPKIYSASVTFGTETASYDREGDIVKEAPVPADLAKKVTEVIPTLVGSQSQLPPMFSAVKVNGQPLYKLARQGLEVERKPRNIHIESIDILAFRDNTVDIDIECSGGTYIRTLAHDLGQAVGCGAHLSGLVRTHIGQFSLEDAISPFDASEDNIIPLSKALVPIPMRNLSELELMRVRNGGSVANTIFEDEALVALADGNGNVISIAKVDDNVLKPECVIPSEAFDAAL
jgi:tRNA pseudouridine55 synthase